MKKIRWNATKLGLLLSFIMIANVLACYYLMHWPLRGNTLMINYSIFIAGLVLILIRFGIKTPSIYLSLYFSEGFKAFIVVTFIMVLFSLLLIKIHPDALALDQFLIENSKQISEAKIKQTQQIAANEADLRSHITTFTIAWMNISHLLLGTLFTFITGGILSSIKTKK
jgi:hypothetical protein